VLIKGGVIIIFDALILWGTQKKITTIEGNTQQQPDQIQSLVELFWFVLMWCSFSKQANITFYCLNSCAYEE